MALSQLENQKIASRYAKALFEAAQEQGQLDKVTKDIQSLQGLYQDLPELSGFFANPVISVEDKQGVVDAKFKSSLTPLTTNLLNLLVQNERISVLPAILFAYTELYQKHQGIAKAEVTIPVAMSSKLENQFRETLEKAFGYKQVELETRIDPAIIAGAIVKIGDKIIDGSYLGKLETLRRQVG